MKKNRFKNNLRHKLNYLAARFLDLFKNYTAEDSFRTDTGMRL